MLSPADWKAEWIADGSNAPEKEEDFYKDDPAPLFRRDFQLRKPVRKARLYIAGIGYYNPSKDFGAALTAPYLHQVSAVNVTVPALTAAVPTVRVPPYVTSIGIPTKPPPSPPRLDGLTIQAL